MPQAPSNRWACVITLNDARASAEQLEELAVIANRLGDGTLRITRTGSVVLLNIPTADRLAVQREFEPLRLTAIRVEADGAGAAQAGTAAARLSALAKNQISQFAKNGTSVWIGCTGYTGEDGFEILAPAGQIESIWEEILALGHRVCLQPAGLGARDTLRTEMGYPLYGHELDENTTPIEAALGFFVALDKGEFNGRSTLADQKRNGTTRRCVAFKLPEKSAPPRPGYAIWSTGPDAAANGQVVSGTQSPSLNTGIGMGFVPPQFAAIGTAIEIEVRGRRWPAAVVAKPLYRKPTPPTSAPQST